MVFQERPPSLRRRLAPSQHVFGNGRFGDLDSEFEQLAVYSRSAHIGLLRLIIRIKSRTSCGTAGRPRFPRRTFQVQYRRKPLRCQAMTVSGFTISRADFQSVQTRRNQTQKIRSVGRSFNRFGADRRSTPSWCRKARFSSRSSTDVLNKEDSTPSSASSC